MATNVREYPAGIKTQDDANKQAIVESLMGTYGLSLDEALDHYESGDWGGLNDTQAVQKRKEEEEDLGFSNRTALSIPYGEEPKKGDTVTQTNVPPGVDAPEIVVDKDEKKSK